MYTPTVNDVYPYRKRCIPLCVNDVYPSADFTHKQSYQMVRLSFHCAGGGV